MRGERPGRRESTLMRADNEEAVAWETSCSWGPGGRSEHES